MKNVKIQIRSRKAIEKMAKIPFEQNTAVISMCDAGDEFAGLENEPFALLQLAFNDIDNDVMIDELGRPATEEERVVIEKKYQMLSDEQASQIADFYFSNADNVDVIVCQCEHGQSRSAAVAAAILEFRSRRGIRIFSDDRYYPNKVVFRKVLAALQNKSENC